MKGACVGVLSIIELRNARWNIEITQNNSDANPLNFITSPFLWNSMVVRSEVEFNP